MKIINIMLAGYWIASAILHAMGVWEPTIFKTVALCVFMAFVSITIALDS